MNFRRETKFTKRNTLSLSEARRLAAKGADQWCIVPQGADLTVARLVVGNELRVVRIRDRTGALLRFPSIQEARRFVRSELGIERTTLLPL
jgi:hypothetical protein